MASRPKKHRLIGRFLTTERAQREDGTSLLIALGFILVIGLLVAVLSSFAFTNPQRDPVQHHFRPRS